MPQNIIFFKNSCFLPPETQGAAPTNASERLPDAFWGLLSVCDQRCHFRIFGECRTAVECRQLDDEVDVDFFRVEALHQFIGCGHGASGGEHVVVKNNDIIGADGVAVDFDYVGAYS